MRSKPVAAIAATITAAVITDIATDVAVKVVIAVVVISAAVLILRSLSLSTAAATIPVRFLLFRPKLADPRPDAHVRFAKRHHASRLAEKADEAWERQKAVRILGGTTCPTLLV